MTVSPPPPDQSLDLIDQPLPDPMSDDPPTELERQLLDGLDHEVDTMRPEILRAVLRVLRVGHDAGRVSRTPSTDRRTATMELPPKWSDPRTEAPTAPGVIRVYGSSDDLIEVDGAITAEFTAQAGSGGDLLAFSDGTLLRIKLGAVWRITTVCHGAGRLTVMPCSMLGDDVTDVAVLACDQAPAWMVLGAAIAAVRA